MTLSAAPVFSHGQFLGACARRQRTAGFEYAELTPTVAPDDVLTHTHQDAHFVLLVRGGYHSTAAGAEPLCRSPLVIYNPPGTTHRDRFETLDGRFFTISLSDAAMREATGVVALTDHPIAMAARTPALGLAQRLARECRSWDAASPLAAEGLTLELLAETARSGLEMRRHPPPWLNRARDLLHDCCAEDLRIAAVAHAVGVHPIHLARAFREHYRDTPGGYLRRCRLSRAATLLTRSAAGLAQVALEAGFHDQSHFTKAFRQAYRMTPGQYRRAHVPE